MLCASEKYQKKRSSKVPMKNDDGFETDKNSNNLDSQGWMVLMVQRELWKRISIMKLQEK